MTADEEQELRRLIRAEIRRRQATLDPETVRTIKRAVEAEVQKIVGNTR